jgi:hypothetical protein
LIRDNFYIFDLGVVQVLRRLKALGKINSLTGEERMEKCILGGLYANGVTVADGVLNPCDRNSGFAEPALENLKKMGYVNESHSSAISYTITGRGEQELEKYNLLDFLSPKVLKKDRPELEQIM